MTVGEQHMCTELKLLSVVQAGGVNVEEGGVLKWNQQSAVKIGENEDQAPSERETWSRRLEFILACIGYAVGLGNIWRFSYLCYRSGGGAFIIPYVVMLFLCGIPLLFLEFSIGQYMRLGPVHAMAKICPLLKGVGVATVVISFLLCTYYNVIIAWALYYLFSSFQSTLPWQNCNNTWNIPENCSSGFTGNATHLQSASQQFFDRRVLQMSSGVDQPGQIRWELLGLLVLAWIIVYLCIFKGIKSTGKVVYFTAIFPYFILIALFINNVQLPGAKDGILYFLTPRWDKLLEVQVWVNAAAQIFNSIGISFGSMISMASYNKFYNNILRDTLIVALTNSATSIFAGLVIFSAIGYMAHIHHLPVDNIATDGPGLVFVVYPEAFVTMPVSPMWAALFFFMLLCLGLDSQFAMVEVMVTSLMDSCGKQLLRVLKRKELLVLAVCLVAFLLGIPNVTQGGIFFFQLLDHHTAVVSLMFLAFFEVVAICWIFGVKRLTRIVTEMLGTPPNMFFKVCWWVISPLLVMVILISSIVQYSPARYGKTYTYPPWAEVLGWFFSLCSIIWIPLGAVHTLYYSEGTLLQRLKSSIIPLDELASVDDLPVKTLANSSRSLSPHMIPEEVPLGREDVG
ncbi:sodium- and chloride-dependent GABA transporter 1-like isoform X1 [Acipenser oxyrinchus oxyrinchus]|uniref:Sodium- and chloride-dependent GABA transporter 1-like isoform X1 n=1 Tax=Acipenser oxyrinchus oxyrinchus TaxID=40147 RepID=A0AAD8D0K6_ACIOX|nr:sodium- and chloride-dependent GABA transporter 1-like isoform X1 [Acipenser oxyrinchus oxyrinchus]